MEYRKIPNFVATELPKVCDPLLLKDAQVKYNGPDKPNPPSERVIITEKSYKKLLELSAREDQSPHEKILTEKTIKKWLKPQGGSFSQETLENGITNFYDSPEHYDQCDQNLFRECAECTYQWHNYHGFVKRIDPIIDNPRELWNAYKANHRSIAGFTARGDRRVPSTRIKAISDAMNDPDYYDPVFAGMRRKDAKDRNIFIDSFANYFREVRVYKRIFDWWIEHPSDMHYSDYELAHIIVQCRAAASYNADKKGMDWHMLPRAVQNTIILFAQCTQMTHSELLYLLQHVDEMANVELIAGSTLYKGTHAWLSGLYPTHHIEGFQNFCSALQLCKRHGFKVIPKPRKLKPDEAFIIVCGDDITVLLGRRLTEQELKEFIADDEYLSLVIWGQILEASKVDYSEEISTFCKKTFALRQNIKGFKHYTDSDQTPIHKFPLNKAIHAIREPEKLPSFPNSRGYAIWVCSIMDNAYGMRDYKSVVIYLYQQNRELFNSVDFSDTSIDEETQLYLDGDWYFRNYVSFDLPTSPTWLLLAYLTK